MIKIRKKRNERVTTTITKVILKYLYSLLIIGIQCYVYYLIFFQSKDIPGLSITMSILGLLFAIILVRGERNISYKLSWIIIILFFPIAGPLFFIVFGHGHYLPRRKNKKINQFYGSIHIENTNIDDIMHENRDAYKMFKLLHTQTNLPLYKNTDIKFFNDGLKEYESLISDLEGAKEYIFLEYFIIGEGLVWSNIRRILEKKAKEGVIIKLVYDDVGSRPVLKLRKLAKLNEIPNVRIASYNPLGKNLNISINYRDHRKIAIIDGRIVHTGGNNLADEYMHYKSRFGFWRDNAIRLEGEAVDSYLIMFAQTWYMSTKEMLNISDYRRYSKAESKGYVFPFGDGPASKERSTYPLFRSLIEQAKKSLYISTPYFIIDSEFIERICIACKSGVDVKILIPAIPDKKTVFMITKAHLGRIIKAGGHVYEYTPGFNHAKNVIVDDMYAYIGTANIDYRSMFLHFECGNLIYHDDCIIKMKTDFGNAIEESQELTYEMWIKRPFIHRIIDFILTIAAPLM